MCRLPLATRDLTQEILVAVWRAWPAFRRQCSERTYVARIAHHRIATHVERAVRLPRRVELADDIPATDLTPEEQVLQGSADLRESLKESLVYLDWLAGQLRYGRILGFVALFAVVMAATTLLMRFCQRNTIGTGCDDCSWHRCQRGPGVEHGAGVPGVAMQGAFAGIQGKVGDRARQSVVAVATASRMRHFLQLRSAVIKR